MKMATAKWFSTNVGLRLATFRLRYVKLNLAVCQCWWFLSNEKILYTLSYCLLRL